jgi:hypothetical protein
MPRIVIDNTVPQFVFDDSSRLSDGKAKLFSDLVRTPVEVAALRQQQERQQLEDLWRDRQWNRQDGLDRAAIERQERDDAIRAMNEMFAGQERQAAEEFRAREAKANDDYRAGRLKVDQQVATDNRNEAWRDDLGAMLAGVSDRLFGKPAATPRARLNAGTGWHQADDGSYFRTSADGVLEVYDPTTGSVQRMSADAPPPMKPTPEQVRETNVRETGFPDREDNWYNPADWFRSAPTPAAGSATAAAVAPAPAATARKAVSAQTLAEYSQKHGLTPDAAAAYLASQGFAVEGYAP